MNKVVFTFIIVLSWIGSCAQTKIEVVKGWWNLTNTVIVRSSSKVDSIIRFPSNIKLLDGYIENNKNVHFIIESSGGLVTYHNAMVSLDTWDLVFMGVISGGDLTISSAVPNTLSKKKFVNNYKIVNRYEVEILYEDGTLETRTLSPKKSNPDSR